MFRKYILCIALAAASFNANAGCEITYFASTDKAEEILRIAIKDAVGSANIDKALESLEIARQKVRAAYKK